jgi:adenine-specific DNA-methyltransferase
MLVHLAPNLATLASVTIPATPFWAIKSGLQLLFKPYFGRVKLIYIDPPYYTEQDFVHPDNYADPPQTYLQLTGQADAEGNLLTSNPETSGRYHSSWPSMM